MKYESYKDSGVEWIGKVPSHWVVAAFKRKITINNGKDYKDFLDEEIYPVMGSGGCFAYCSKYMFDGEALLLGRKGTIDKPLYINGKFWAVDTMFYATPHKDLNCKFAYYLALTFPFQLYSTSTALPSMTQTDLGNNPVAFPPIVEQQAIALYLDKKCEEIDRAIDTQKKKIELLNELKQTIITNAVTRGLNPDAPMKDSGAEWIGKIPKHWDMVKIKFNFNIYAGATPKTEVQNYWDGDIVWITPADYKTKDKYISCGQRHISKDGYNSCNTQIVPKGSLIFSKRAPIGTVALAETELCTNQGCLSCVPRKCSSLYYYYVTSVYTEIFDLLGSGATFKEISANDFANIKLPSPTYEEQLAIVSSIEKEVSKIDKQISITNQHIELLNELKQSIITEAVTGKIKVC